MNSFHDPDSGRSRRCRPIRLLPLMFVTIVACQTTVLHFVPPENRGRSLKDREPALSETYKSLGLGIYEFSKSPENPCPDSLESIVIRRNWLDATIHFFIGGVYTTRRIEFYCTKMQAPS